MDVLLAVLLAAAGGLAGGLVGVGGGILFVPALTVLGLGQVEAESTSLLMIVVVALVGARRQAGYGNVDLAAAAIVGLLSPLGVLAGVVVANNVSERLLQLGFAAVALFFAFRLVRRATVHR
jgi:uncharacterized membrane protein YfcA